MRDSMVFYRSFADAIGRLDDEDAGKICKAVMRYALDGIEPELEGAMEGYFLLMKPQIDANNQRYENGKKGGRPPEVKPKENQAETKPKPKENQTETNTEPNVNVNDNVNENVNIKESVKEKPQKHKYGSYGNVRLTDAELDKLNNDYGESKTEAAIRFLDEYIAEKDYKSKSHYLAMRRWVFQAVEDRKTKKPDNRLGAFGNYKQSSTDEEWDELTALALREVNGK